MKTILLCGLLSCGLIAHADDATKVLFKNDFEKAEAGKLPEELMVLGGEFTVKSDGTNQFLELPGAPLDSYGLQFGPTEKEDVAVSARVFGTAKGRRAPTFGVGLGGVGGWKLQVSPGKKALELLKDQESKASVPFDWKGGAWTQLRLQIRKLKDGAWKIEGKAWPVGTTEPKESSIVADEPEEPIAGKASVLASPFAGTRLGLMIWRWKSAPPGSRTRWFFGGCNRLRGLNQPSHELDGHLQLPYSEQPAESGIPQRAFISQR